MKRILILCGILLFINKTVGFGFSFNSEEKEPELPVKEEAEYFTHMDKDREDFVLNGQYYFCMRVVNAKIDNFIIYKNEKVIRHRYNDDYLIFCLGPIKSTDFLTNDFFVQYVYKANKSGKVKVSRKLYILSYYPGYEKIDTSHSYVLSSYY